MKKILAVLIAISMVATMAFAADFAFSVEHKGEILKYVVGDDFVSLPTRTDVASATMTMSGSVDDGKAGVSASVTFKTEAAGTFQPKFDFKCIWIVPVENVKLTFGGTDFNVGAVADFDRDADGEADVYGAVGGNSGFAVEYTGIENLYAGFGMAKDLTTKTLNTENAFNAKLAYTVSDAAKIEFTVDSDLDMGASVYGTISPITYIAAFDKTGDEMKVAEKVTIEAAPVTVWEAVEYKLDTKAVTALEGLTVALDPVTITQHAEYVNEVISAGAKAEVKVAPVTCWVEAKTEDVKAVADNVALTAGAKVAFSGNVGAAAWSVTPEVDVDILQDFAVTVKVPYSVKITF